MLHPTSVQPTERRGVFNVTEMESITEEGEDYGEVVDYGKPRERSSGNE